MTDATPTDLRPSRRDARLRCLLIVVFCIFAGIFCFAPIRNHLRKGTNKDYPLWFDTGQRVLRGDSAFYKDSNGEFPFMYPPAAAAVLAPITFFGKLPMVILMVAINTVAWLVCILAPIYLVAGTTRGQPPIVYALPSLICTYFIWSTYLLGGPAIVLAACILGMFICLRKRIDWAAGFLLAFAAGFKAFPILALPYLIWRRHWRALGWTCLFLALLLLFLPAVFRGPRGAIDDMRAWTIDTLGSYNSETIGQRKDRSYLWMNGSIIAEAHRLLRPVIADYEDKDPTVPIVYVNFANLSFKQINIVLLAATMVLCLSYLAIMPRGPWRTRWTDTIEMAMLMILIITFTPLSFTYNNAWLMLPMVVVLHFILAKAKTRRERTIATIWLTISLLMLIPTAGKLNVFRYLRSLGNTFWSCISLYVELMWIMARSREPLDGGERDNLVPSPVEC